MYKRLNNWDFALFGFLLFFATARSAHAYIDPGTGSFVFQLLIAGLLGSLFFIKTIFRTIKDFFLNLFSSKKKAEANTEKNNEKNE